MLGWDSETVGSLFCSRRRWPCGKSLGLEVFKECPRQVSRNAVCLTLQTVCEDRAVRCFARHAACKVIEQYPEKWKQLYLERSEEKLE